MEIEPSPLLILDALVAIPARVLRVLCNMRKKENRLHGEALHPEKIRGADGLGVGHRKCLERFHLFLSKRTWSSI